MLQLSATKITTYMDCPLKFKFRYIDHIEPDTVAPALAFGSSFHSAVKCFHTQLMAGAAPDVDAIRDMFVEYWRAAQTVPIAWNGDTPETLEQTGLTMLDCYIAGFADTKSPIAVETSFTTPVINLLTGETLEDVTITGIIDRITADGTPVELKTASRAWTQFNADSSLQIGVRCHAPEFCSNPIFHLKRHSVSTCVFAHQGNQVHGVALRPAAADSL